MKGRGRRSFDVIFTCISPFPVVLLVQFWGKIWDKFGRLLRSGNVSEVSEKAKRRVWRRAAALDQTNDSSGRKVSSTKWPIRLCQNAYKHGKEDKQLLPPQCTVFRVLLPLNMIGFSACWTFSGFSWQSIHKRQIWHGHGSSMRLLSFLIFTAMESVYVLLHVA